jgi:hypothetical protein
MNSFVLNLSFLGVGAVFYCRCHTRCLLNAFILPRFAQPSDLSRAPPEGKDPFAHLLFENQFAHQQLLGHQAW